MNIWVSQLINSDINGMFILFPAWWPFVVVLQYLTLILSNWVWFKLNQTEDLDKADLTECCSISTPTIDERVCHYVWPINLLGQIIKNCIVCWMHTGSINRFKVPVVKNHCWPCQGGTPIYTFELCTSNVNILFQRVSIFWKYYVCVCVLCCVAWQSFFLHIPI